MIKSTSSNTLQKKFALILFLSYILIFLLPMTVIAEDLIKLRVEDNFKEQYKFSEMIPIAITIENNSKNDIDGTVYIDLNNYYENDALYYENVYIPQGTTKKITISVPANNLIAEPVVILQEGNQILANEKLNRINIEEMNYNPSNNYWSLKNASIRIPALNLPDLNKLILFFIGYILLIGPVLYFILKRKNKRELAWYIIPVISIIISFAFYQVALLSRGDEVMSHNVSYLDIKDAKNAELSTASSIFVPYSGDYTINYGNLNYLLPIDDTNNNKKTWISVSDGKGIVKYENIDFWSFKSVYLKNNLTDLGEFESGLRNEDGKLTGTISNNSKLNLTDTKLIYKGNVFDLGDFSTFESKHIDISYTPSYNTSNSYMYIEIERLFPDSLVNDPKRYQTRESVMLEMFSAQPFDNLADELIIIGWTDEAFIQLDILTNEHVEYNLTLVKDTIEFAVEGDYQANTGLPNTNNEGGVN